MSSTEQAPEPTMDEILASIRKIISDDEPGHEASDGGAAAEASADASMDGSDAADEGDDILDLTQVVQPQSEAPPAHADPVHPPMPPEAATPAPTDSDIASILAEAGVEETVADSPASAAHSMESAPQPSAEEASITEALKAMNDMSSEAHGAAPAEDAFMTEAEPGDVSMGAPAPSLPDEPAQEDDARDALDDLVASLETDMNASQDASMDTADEQAIEMPAPAETAEPEIAMPEPETPADDLLAPAPSIDDVRAEPVMEDAAPRAVEPPPIAQDTDAGTDDVFTANHAGDDATASSFEQGIKDMIKPMLREWLDTNMERIVHDAVKEEVTSGDQ